VYLRALGKLKSLGLDSRAAQFYYSGQWQGADPLACERAGGIVTVTYSGTAGAGAGYTEKAYFGCRMPAYAPQPQAAPLPQPITITVPTSVQTTVSPQISPVFVQQDEPRDSPVTAGTVQASPAPQSSFVPSGPTESKVSGPSAEFFDYLRAQQERDAAREQAWLDLFAARSPEGAAPSAPSPVYEAPAPISYTTSGSAPVPDAEPVAAARVPEDNRFTMIALLAAAVGLFALQARKGR